MENPEKGVASSLYMGVIAIVKEHSVSYLINLYIYIYIYIYIPTHAHTHTHIHTNIS